jgi:hypothetical protein
MFLTNDEKGNLILLNKEGKVFNYDSWLINGITLDLPDAAENHLLSTRISLINTNVDVVGFCKGLNRNIRLVEICNVCGEIGKNCTCGKFKKSDPISNSISISLREVDGSNFPREVIGYVKSASIKQDATDERPIISFWRYKVKNGVVDQNEKGEPILEEF